MNGDYYYFNKNYQYATESYQKSLGKINFSFS